MATTWNQDRWTKPKVNEAGDTVYERKIGTPKTEPKKTPAKKKA